VKGYFGKLATAWMKAHRLIRWLHEQCFIDFCLAVKTRTKLSSNWLWKFRRPTTRSDVKPRRQQQKKKPKENPFEFFCKCHCDPGGCLLKKWSWTKHFSDLGSRYNINMCWNCGRSLKLNEKCSVILLELLVSELNL